MGGRGRGVGAVRGALCSQHTWLGLGMCCSLGPPGGTGCTLASPAPRAPSLLPATAILFATVMMLRHVQLPSFADRIEDAITSTLEVRRRRRLPPSLPHLCCQSLWVSPHPLTPALLSLPSATCCARYPARRLRCVRWVMPPYADFVVNCQQDKKNWTKDVGGTASTSQFVDAIVSKL